MAVGTPWAIDGTTIPGKELRQLLQSLLGGTVGAFAGGVSASDRAHGIVVSTDLAVTQKGTPNMSVDVSSGSAFVRGTEAATQGVMWAYNDATTNLVIAAADATNPRKDLVVLQLRDDDYSGAFRDARLFVVTGTPAASPADPTPPANSLVLARVSVAALASSIVNANIADLRRRAGGLGGEVVTTSAARPTTGLYPGMRIFETDTFRHLVYQSATTLWTPEWNTPWGEVLFKELGAANVGPITAEADITGMTSTFTAIANRNYQITAWLNMSSTVTGDVGALIINANAANVGTPAYVTLNNVSQVAVVALARVTGLAAGVRTIKLRAKRNTGSGNVTVHLADVGSFRVDDVGPSANPA